METGAGADQGTDVGATGAGGAQGRRRALVDAAREAGMAAPTLCAGWTVRDLLAHVHARDTDLRTPLGALPVARGLAERARVRALRLDDDALLHAVLAGPGRFSPWRLPPVAAGNLWEFYVHTEDIRRPNRLPERPLAAEDEASLFATTRRLAVLQYRGAPVGVALALPDGPPRVVRRRRDTPTVTVRGTAGELALFGAGREAAVTLEGPGAAVRAVRDLPRQV